MAITVGLTYIVLFAVFQSIWLVSNCQGEPDLTGIVRLYGIDKKITLIPMKVPTNAASGMDWIETLNLPNKFEVHRMKEQLKTKIDSLSLLPDDQFRNKFAEIIQEAIYEDLPKEHSNWIVIPFGFSKFSTKEDYVQVPHIDLLRKADIATLLQHYKIWSQDFLEFLAKNNHVKTAALAHYNGNVERYAMEMLTLDYTMNIWIPIEPVKAWPLAFTPDTQCDKTSAEEGQHQYLSRFESAPNDWYTRWNMQTNELYVWDSRTVPHAAVKIGDGKGERSSIACRLMIVHPKEDSSPPISSPPKYDTLCYTDRFFESLSPRVYGEAYTEETLAEMGYHEPCADRFTNLPPSPSNDKTDVIHCILLYFRKILDIFCL